MASENSLYAAAYSGDLDSVKSKVDENSQLIFQHDDNGRILLHWAALSGNVRLVEYLIEKQSPIDPVDDTASTPLILSSSAGRTEVVKYLLLKGANPNHKTSQGHSALQYACSKGWLDVITETPIASALLASAADINIVDMRGATPLHRAASKGNFAIVKLLVAYKDSAGLRVDSKDVEGNTPLHLACEEDRQEEAIILIESGADMEVNNREGKTPLDLCSYALYKVLILRKPESK